MHHPRTPAPVLGRLCLLLCLLAAALLGNVFSVPLFFGVDFLFGGIAVLLVLRLFGLRWGALAGLIAGSWTWVLWGHPFAALLLTLEPIVVGLLQRRRDESLVLFDALFWCLVGAPLVWLSYHHVMGMDPSATLLVILKLGVNGLSQALMASLLLTHTPLARLAGHPAPYTTSLRQVLFDLFASLVLFPAFLLVILHSRLEVSRLEEDIALKLEVYAAGLANAVEHWKRHHEAAVQGLAGVALTTRFHPERLQEATRLTRQAFPDFHNLYVADATATTIAFDPPVNARGDSTIGLNFADRSYFRTLRQTLRPVTSSVIMGRGGVFEPIITLSVPVLREGAIEGFALGAVNLDRLRSTLRLEPRGRRFQATLIDGTGLVISSTDSSLMPGSRYDHAAGWTVRPREDSRYHRMPGRPHMPPMLRWAGSFYGLERRIDGTPWRLYVETPAAPYVHRLQARYLLSFGLVLLLSLLALLLARALATRLVSPLARLARETTDLPERLHHTDRIDWPASTIREVGAMERNFQQMVTALRRQFQAMQEARAALEDRTLELSRLSDELRAADRAKDEFLAMLAHELRNPLAPIRTALHVLERQSRATGAAAGDPESQHGDGEKPAGSTPEERARAIIARQVKHMVRLVDDLLDVSRITRGKIELRRQRVDLAQAITNALETTQALLQERRHQVVIELPGTPVWLDADPTRLEQILSNLLNNAAKYTDPGGSIRISAEVRASEVEIKIRDNGMGIPAPLVPRIFDLFIQLDRSLDRSQGGLGIGLTLVRTLVEMHGGRIEAFSEGPGKGSEFVLTLPTPPSRGE